jgi:hypothetical protein
MATDDRERGWYRKYDVKRLNDPNGRHADCEYFVLDLEHDAHSTPALLAYADAAEAKYPALAADIRRRVGAHSPELRSETATETTERIFHCGCEKVDRCERDKCPKCCYCGRAPEIRTVAAPDPAVVLSAACDVLDNMSASPVEGYLVPEHIIDRLRRALDAGQRRPTATASPSEARSPEPDGDAHRRLMDLLAGWHQYVLRCSEAEDPPAPEPYPETYLAEFDRIHDLYQEVGRASCPTEATLRDFLDRVIGMVFTGTAVACRRERATPKPLDATGITDVIGRVQELLDGDVIDDKTRSVLCAARGVMRAALAVAKEAT